MSSFQTPLSTQQDAVQRAATKYSESLASLPAQTWQTLGTRRYASQLPKGLDAAYSTFTGWFVPMKPRKTLSMRAAQKVVGLEKAYAGMTDDVLQEKIFEQREAFRRKRETKDNLIHSMAMIREAAKRVTGMQPYPVQVAAGISLSQRNMVEMATGEGKSLVATMPAIVAGWRGRGCHVMTVNDYLAARDAREFKKLFSYCGLRVSHVDGSMMPPERRAAYQADVTYCTNKEVAADFLRDRLLMGRVTRLTQSLLKKFEDDNGLPGQFTQSGPEHLVMRGLEVAIIDESDSILVDEAVTPLIISAESGDEAQLESFSVAAKIAAELSPNHYKINAKYREVDLTKEGKAQVAEIAEGLNGVAGGLFEGRRLREELVTQALSARHLFLNGQQYVVMDGKVVIVDESTGRLMPDRSWRAGLHQAVEAKEQVEVSPVKDTLARISFQRFFRMYKNLCGMSGTLMEARGELWQIYQTPTVPIPTHKPRIRVDEPMQIFATRDEKWNRVAEHVEAIHKTGRPILIGTRSVEDSELLSQLLESKKLEHQVINAVKHEEEAEIVSEAGERGKITVATNMAGRGTDIKLGKGIAELGGLCVIATDRHESARVDRQLYGRAGRQGDPGTAVTFVAYEDELIRRYGKGKTTGGQALFDKAQKRSGHLARIMRKGVLKNDDWLDEYLGFAGREH